ncbi:tRNA (adenosine(37)-N6)-threonylcarbamoyltransferase complex ATPase subunit type 1 TsaE [bacterium]|nr:tRNA (adenosine(37)-N6)-threonylcarbamoyltransferase complex ATPase subunit type 1 TsaE [bacterium]
MSESHPRYFDQLVLELRSWISETKGTRVLYLEGDLGVGKTQLTKELLCSFGFSMNEVQSPTFLKMLEYDVPSLGRVLHLDCYRMDEAEDLENLSLEHYIDQVELIIVEWPSLFKQYLKLSGLDRLWIAACSQKSISLKPHNS